MSKLTRRKLLAYSGAALAAPMVSRGSFAQGAYPNRQIRAIVPFTAGSTVDVVGRMVLEPLGQALGQTFIVENKGGAGGTIGTAQVAKAEPDGYTILINASAHSSSPAVYPNAPYDAAKDLAAVIPFGSVPNVLVIAPSKGIKTAKELAEKAKAGNMTFSSAGVGSATHWAAERFRASAGFQAQHVPFKGGPEALTEVMTGRIDFCCIGITSGMPFIRDKTLVPLAVSTPKRAKALPDVPTTIEAGFPDSDYIFWNGLLVPAKTPREIVNKLHAETKKVLESPAVMAKLAPLDNEPMPMSPAEFDALIRKEIEANIKLAKAIGLKTN